MPRRTSDVLPTPGDPSSSTGLGICIARSRRAALRAVDGALNANALPPATCAPCATGRGEGRGSTELGARDAAGEGGAPQARARAAQPRLKLSQQAEGSPPLRI